MSDKDFLDTEYVGHMAAAFNHLNQDARLIYRQTMKQMNALYRKRPSDLRGGPFMSAEGLKILSDAIAKFQLLSDEIAWRMAKFQASTSDRTALQAFNETYPERSTYSLYRKS